MFKKLIILVVLLLASIPLFAQSVNQFRQGRIDEKTGIPRALYFIDDLPRQGTPDQVTRDYLKTKIESLKLNPDLSDLSPVIVQESPMGYHITCEQTYEGVPVYRSSIVVTLDRNNRVVFLANDYKPNLSLPSTQPVISQAEAVSISLAHFNVEQTFEGFPKSQLIVYAEDVIPRLAYQITIAARVPSGSWEVIVDAQNGEILQVLSLIFHINGMGYIFNPDPLTSAGAAYGDSGYTDNNDANSPQLEAQRQPVQLNDITFDGVEYRLQGPYCTIEDWTSPTVPPVTETSPDGFRYTRDQSGFEDVMVYYFIDHIHRYILSLGFNITGLAIKADPHGAYGSDNSYYDGGANRLCFGEGGVDDAEDADVIWHEMGHAVQYAQFNFGTIGGECALGEGFCDYWAGSYSKSRSSFRSEWVFNWDGHNEFWEGRILSDSRIYPPGGVGSMGCHDAGQIWSSVLMQIWDVVGREVLDKCVLQSHYLLGDNPTMRDNAAAIIQADLSLYDGAHAHQMGNRFNARNFNIFIRGDVNSDWKLNVSDVIYLINYLFKGGPSPNPIESGDVNCDGKVTVSDVVYLINYLFKGGPAPC